MHEKRSDKQKLRWGAAGQCLLIALSFLPVWLLRANEAPQPETETVDTLTTINPIWHSTPETTYQLDIPRP